MLDNYRENRRQVLLNKIHAAEKGAHEAKGTESDSLRARAWYLRDELAKIEREYARNKR